MADYVNIINQNDMIPKGSKVINEQGEEIGTMKRNKFNKGDRVMYDGVSYSITSINGIWAGIWDGYDTCYAKIEHLKPYTDSPLDKQEGGDHYKDCKIQPIEYITANNLDFMQGNIVKYITRHKSKNGAEDIKKIKHYCDLILKLEYNE